MTETQIDIETFKVENEQKEVILKVAEILEQDERARNSDLWLIIQFWRKSGIRIFVPYEQLDNMTSAETITRARRVVQNDHNKFLPTNPEVLHKRKVKEEILREYFSNRPDIIGQWEQKCGQ